METQLRGVSGFVLQEYRRNLLLRLTSILAFKFRTANSHTHTYLDLWMGRRCQCEKKLQLHTSNGSATTCAVHLSAWALLVLCWVSWVNSVFKHSTLMPANSAYTVHYFLLNISLPRTAASCMWMQKGLSEYIYFWKCPLIPLLVADMFFPPWHVSFTLGASYIIYCESYLRFIFKYWYC